MQCAVVLKKKPRPAGPRAVYSLLDEGILHTCKLSEVAADVLEPRWAPPGAPSSDRARLLLLALFLLLSSLGRSWGASHLSSLSSSLALRPARAALPSLPGGPSVSRVDAVAPGARRWELAAAQQ
ncbi:unnamed protein product, partial [Prorocentrum cordatum]